MFADLKAAKDWSIKYDVPIFLGEFGYFSKLPTIEDRCRHAETVYSALGKLDIPNAWWNVTAVLICLKKARRALRRVCERRLILITQENRRKRF